MKRLSLVFILLAAYTFNAIAVDTTAIKTIKGITDKMLELISGPIGAERDWEEYRNLFLPNAQKVSLRPDAEPNRQIRNHNIEEFIRSTGPLFARDGFIELSTGLTVHEYNGIAMVFQSYIAKNLLGTYEKRGINCYQLVFSDDRWWIASTTFVNEDPDNPIPQEFLKEETLELQLNSDAHMGKWKKLTTEPYRGKQDDIVFISENEGWYVNGIGRIYHTTDAGENWELQLEKPGTFFRCIAMVDDQLGFAGTVGTEYYPNVSNTIALYGTKDGGQSWYPVPYAGPYVQGLCAIDIVHEEYINQGKLDQKTHIYAVGRVGSPANMMVSHDGGETWSSKSMSEDCNMLFDIKMFNKNEGVACAATDADVAEGNALILKTYDGGQSWKKVYQSDRPYENVWKVSFWSEQIRYATIQSYDRENTQQRFVKTTDAGETWTEMNLVNDAQARSFGIGFLDEQHGYIGTMNSGYETLDGGETWSAVPLGRACNKIRIYEKENGKKYGYAIGVDVFKLE